ncbi:MAG: hypothetical protein V3V19_10875 [Cocleimonas sp.]
MATSINNTQTVSTTASLLPKKRLPTERNNFKSLHTASSTSLLKKLPHVKSLANTQSQVASNVHNNDSHIKGEWDGFKVTISNGKYSGKTPHLERAPNGNDLVDRIAYFNFEISGNVSIGIKCTEVDKSGNSVREWSKYGLASVSEVKFQVPFDEPAIPMPGMVAVIWADKVLNVGQYALKWKNLISTAVKATVNSPSLICRGESFLNKTKSNN